VLKGEGGGMGWKLVNGEDVVDVVERRDERPAGGVGFDEMGCLVKDRGVSIVRSGGEVDGSEEDGGEVDGNEDEVFSADNSAMNSASSATVRSSAIRVEASVAGCICASFFCLQIDSGSSP